MESTAILVLGYNRPDYLKNLLDFLREQENFRLYISIDGPVSNSTSDETLVNECRKLAIQTQEWTDAKLLLSESNNGCYMGVTKGIDWFFSHEEFGVILEDDLVFDSNAIRFLNNGLSEYADRPDVGTICAFNHLSPYSISDEPISSLMVSFPSSWGWATWRDRWVKLERDFSRYPYPLFIYKSLKYGGLSGARSWLQVRKRLQNASLDSWAYRWLLTNCRYGWKAIVPSRSLVTNIGFRADATHTKDAKKTLGVQDFVREKSHPDIIITAMLEKEYDQFLLRNIYGVIPMAEKIIAKIRNNLQ